MMRKTENDKPQAKLVTIHSRDRQRRVAELVLQVHVRARVEERGHLGDLCAESGQTLQGSFSAVSKPNFASTYSLESSRRDPHNALESNPSMKRNERKEDGKT